MLTILHGDNQINSRVQLVKLIQRAKEQNHAVITLVADKLEPPNLEEALTSQGLFYQNKLVIIEALHSLPTSQRKKTLTKLILKATQQSEAPDIILWEKRPLTKTMLKKFSQVKVEEFKMSQKLWQFLDTLGNPARPIQQQLKLLDQVCHQEDPHFVFLMIIRQLRLLIQAQENHFVGAPFMIAKLKKQVQFFTLRQLLALHQQLFEIEIQLKTSANLLDLKSLLDLWLVSLYK